MRTRKQRHVAVPTGPGTGGTGGDDVAVSLGGARGWCDQIPVLHGELNEAIKQVERRVVGDMLLRLRGGDVGEREVRSGHQCLM